MAQVSMETRKAQHERKAGGENVRQIARGNRALAEGGTAL